MQQKTVNDGKTNALKWLTGAINKLHNYDVNVCYLILF